MAERMKVALGQLRPRLGDVSRNLDIHLEWALKAKSENASLIVFPELGLTGYQVQDLTLDVARQTNHPDIAKLVDISREIDIVFSFVEESREHLFYTSSVYASGGRIAAVHRKVYLPTYGMFDEGRYFAAGDTFRTFDSKMGQTGLLICEDAWHASSPYLLAAGGANVICVPASSPARSVAEQEGVGSHLFWKQMLQVYAQLFGTFFIFVNRVGFEDGINFFGGSGIISPTGQWVAEAPELDECIVYGEVDLSVVRKVRFTNPLLRDEKHHLVMKELARLARQSEEAPF